MLPVDQPASFSIYVCYDPEEFVLGVVKGDGLKGKAVHAEGGAIDGSLFVNACNEITIYPFET